MKKLALLLAMAIALSSCGCYLQVSLGIDGDKDFWEQRRDEGMTRGANE